MRYLLNLLVLIVFAVAGYGQTKMVVQSDTYVNDRTLTVELP